MGSLIEYFLIAIAGMFVIVNPLTTAFVFASLTASATDRERHDIARRAVVMSTATLFTFALLRERAHPNPQALTQSGLRASLARLRRAGFAEAVRLYNRVLGN